MRCPACNGEGYQGNLSWHDPADDCGYCSMTGEVNLYKWLNYQWAKFLWTKIKWKVW